MRTLTDHILDILENSARASATLIEIIILEEKRGNLYTLEIRDNGCGMTGETAAKALDPFFTSRKSRKVGLGLPLLEHSARQAGGAVEVSSLPGKGTLVKACFGLDHLDRPPLGDVSDIFLLSAAGHPGIAFEYRHTTDSGTFSLSTKELKETLGEVPLTHPEIREALRQLVRNNLAGIRAAP